VLDVLFPVACAACRTRGVALCEACIASFPCATPSRELIACFAYEGAVREVIARAKYRNERAALRVLARRLASRVPRDVGSSRGRRRAVPDARAPVLTTAS
jgi:predicted amidophosphoribosyltransferase